MMLPVLNVYVAGNIVPIAAQHKILRMQNSMHVVSGVKFGERLCTNTYSTMVITRRMYTLRIVCSQSLLYSPDDYVGGICLRTGVLSCRGPLYACVGRTNDFIGTGSVLLMSALLVVGYCVASYCYCSPLMWYQQFLLLVILCYLRFLSRMLLSSILIAITVIYVQC